MANIKSAIKRAKKSKKLNERNRVARSALRTAIKKVEETVKSADFDAAQAEMLKAVKVIDKAAAKNLLHKNNAANKKSRLAKLVNSIQK